MSTGLDVEHRVVVKAPAAKHIGIEQACAPATVVAGLAGKFVVIAGFVDRAGRIVVVFAVVDIVVEGTGAHHGAVVVFTQNHLAQCAHPVGGQAVLIEVAVRVIGVNAHQAIARITQAHADAIAGGDRPIDGCPVVEFNRLSRPRRTGYQRHGDCQAGELEAFIVVFIDHTGSPD